MVLDLTVRRAHELIMATKKKRIPATLKRVVWHTYIGEEIGRHPCMCCNITMITQMSFHCGHVIPEAKGGPMTVENMRPICNNCNASMGTQDMSTFMTHLTSTAPMDWSAAAD